MAVCQCPCGRRMYAKAQFQTCRWLHPAAMLLVLSVLSSVSGSFDTSISAALRCRREGLRALASNAPGCPVRDTAVAADGRPALLPLSADKRFDWDRPIVDKRNLRQQQQQEGAVRVWRRQGSGRGSSSSSARRHLLQHPPPLQQLPPNIKQQPPKITIQELLANVGVSADNGSVQVKLPAVTVPGNDTQKATQLPPVVVNLRISDLFPDDVRGKKLLHELQPDTITATNSQIAEGAQEASSVGASSSSSKTARQVAATEALPEQPAALRPSRRLYTSVQRSNDVAGQVAAASTGRRARHLLQRGAASGSRQLPTTGGSSSDQADQALLGYLRQNPDSASNLQQLSGDKSPQLGPDTRSATLCELVGSQCTPGGRRRLRGNSLVFTLAAAVSAMLPGPDAASAVARAAAAAVASHRRLLDSIMPAGLDRWMESADNTDREYAQQLLGKSAPTTRASIPEVVASNTDSPQPKRKAARLLLSYAPAPCLTAPGRQLQNLDSGSFGTWFRGASVTDQQYARQLGLVDGAAGKKGDKARIPSVVGGDAGSRRGSTALGGANTNQGGRGGSLSGNTGGNTGGGSATRQQSAGGQQRQGSDGGLRRRRQLLQGSSGSATEGQKFGSTITDQGRQHASGQQQQPKRNHLDDGSQAIADWKSQAGPDDRKFVDVLTGNTDKLEPVPKVRLSEIVPEPGGSDAT